MKGRQGRRRMQLLNDLKKTKGYWKLKQDLLDHSLLRNRSGKIYGHFLRETTELINYECINSFVCSR